MAAGQVSICAVVAIEPCSDVRIELAASDAFNSSVKHITCLWPSFDPVLEALEEGETLRRSGADDTIASYGKVAARDVDSHTGHVFDIALLEDVRVDKIAGGRLLLCFVSSSFGGGDALVAEDAALRCW